MADWACRSCRSVNADRISRCYKCRAPRDLVQLDPTSSTLGPPTEEVPRDPRAPRDTRAIAVLAALAIWAAVIFHALATIWANDVLAAVANGSLGDLQLQRGSVLVLAFYGSVLVALVLWATWVSVVLGNIPKLGVGWPAVTPGLAFFEHFVPIWNLWRTPSLIRILFRHLPGMSGPDDGIVAIWIGPLLGVVLVPRVMRWIGFFADGDGRIGLAVLESWLVVVALVVSAVAAVVILWRIEERQGLAARRLTDGVAAAQPAD